MRLVWSPRALTQLQQMEAYIAEDNPIAAVRMTERIYDSAERLLPFPASGRPGRLPHTRELVVTGTPYFLPYRVQGDVVEILGVIHGARMWPRD